MILSMIADSVVVGKQGLGLWGVSIEMGCSFFYYIGMGIID
jgi:hypothetical protein